MSEFDYDVFGEEPVEEIKKVVDDKKETVKPKVKPKKAAPKAVKASAPKPKDDQYDIFGDSEPAKEEPVKEVPVKKANVERPEDDYAVFNDDKPADEKGGYYDSEDGGYQDEGGSSYASNRKIQSGEVAGLATAAVVGAAISKSNKVPKSVKNAINPNYQNEKKQREQEQFLNARREKQKAYEKKMQANMNGGKKPIYKRWWFWLILGLLLLSLIGACFSGDDTSDTAEKTTVAEEASTTTTTTETTTETTTSVPKVYSVPAGATVEKLNGKWGLYKDGQLVEGYTGVASNSLGDWYIVNGLVDFNYSGTIKDGTKEYQVNGGKAVEYANGTTAAPKLSPKDYKAKCKKISYEDLARNPDQYKGEYVKFYGKVVQVQNQTLLGVDIGSVILRVATKDSGYDSWYDDVVYVTYTKHEGEGNILEDDFVTLYGIYDGTETYTTVMGASVTIPAVDAEYIDVQ